MATNYNRKTFVQGSLPPVNADHMNGIETFITSIAEGGTGSVAKADLSNRSNIWSSTIAYSVNDIINYQGTLYKCVIANTNIVPSTDLTGSWLVVKTGGSGGAGINYILNGDFDTYTTLQYWSQYNDGAVAVPVDGTGGTVTSGFILARSTTSPLFSTADMVVTKPASGIRGQGFSTDFTIDNGSVGQPLTISFSYITSSGYVSNDLGVYVYDITNSVVLSPSIVNVPSSYGTSTIYTSTFLPSTSLSYRLIFHYQSTSAQAYTLEIDNIYVSPQSKLIGGAIGATQTYPLTIGATTTAPTKGTVAEDIATWARHGDKMIWSYRYRQSALGSANVGSGTYLFPLPTGYNIDLTKHPIGSTVGACKASSMVDETSQYTSLGIVVVYSSTQVKFVMDNPISATQNLNEVSSGGFGLTLSANMSYTAEATFTINGWTSNINLATDFTEYAYNTRAAINTNDSTSFGKGSGGAAILANTAAVYYDVQFDRPIQATDDYYIELHSKIDGAWVRADLAAVDSLFCKINFDFGGNGVAGENCGFFTVRAVSGTNKVRVRMSERCIGFPSWAKAQAATERLWSAIIAAADGYDRWRVRKVSNGNMAEVPPTVFASYKNTGNATTLNTQINWDIKVEDTHNAVITGASWRFIAPIAGIYNISGQVYTSSGSPDIYIYKNGVSVANLGNITTASFRLQLSYMLRLQVGDYIDFRPNITSTISSDSSLQIARIGS